MFGKSSEGFGKASEALGKSSNLFGNLGEFSKCSETFVEKFEQFEKILENDQNLEKIGIFCSFGINRKHQLYSWIINEQCHLYLMKVTNNI